MVSLGPIRRQVGCLQSFFPVHFDIGLEDGPEGLLQRRLDLLLQFKRIELSLLLAQPCCFLWADPFPL